ncbi:MAG: glutaredoxin family protein [Pseudohongiella sp.]|jgi:hypothetical protein|nr:glutaredoxin family protein [Pseudohongiella sp.]
MANNCLLLYTTAGCHLCEQAEQLLAQLSKLSQAQSGENQLQITAVDISIDEGLVEAYGIRIPVVKNTLTNEEIGWPFTLANLQELLKPV